jgi:hypothetical protein
MALASLACAVFVGPLVEDAPARAIALGVLGPFAAAAGAWVVMTRAHERAPERLTAVMIRLFGLKMVLFGAYVAAVVILLPAGRLGFIVSFTSAYILLHVMEALYLRRLLAAGMPAAAQ